MYYLKLSLLMLMFFIDGVFVGWLTIKYDWVTFKDIRKPAVYSQALEIAWQERDEWKFIATKEAKANRLWYAEAQERERRKR